MPHSVGQAPLRGGIQETWAEVTRHALYHPASAPDQLCHCEGTARGHRCQKDPWGHLRADCQRWSCSCPACRADRPAPPSVCGQSFLWGRGKSSPAFLLIFTFPKAKGPLNCLPLYLSPSGRPLAPGCPVSEILIWCESLFYSHGQLISIRKSLIAFAGAGVGGKGGPIRKCRINICFCE